MTIEYLKELEANPFLLFSDGYKFTNRGISLAEIQQLEQLYNNGNPFPKVLKELLYLAGDFCWCLDMGSYDTQQELQDELRDLFLRVFGVTITRPHYFVDVRVFDMPMFIHLDEGDNPPLHQLMEEPTPTNYIEADDPGLFGRTIVTMIKGAIERYKNGEPIF